MDSGRRGSSIEASTQARRRACPICGESTHTAKVSAIYRSQTATYESESRSRQRTTLFNVLVRRDAFRTYGWTTKTRGTRSTVLAQALAPPKAPGGAGCLLVMGLLVAFLVGAAIKETAGLLVGILIFALFFWLAVQATIAGTNPRGRYRVAVDRWERAYYCSADDVVFLPGSRTAYPLSKLAVMLGQPVKPRELAIVVSRQRQAN